MKFVNLSVIVLIDPELITFNISKDNYLVNQITFIRVNEHPRYMTY